MRYERFREGRNLWGLLLIGTRSLTRQALTMTVNEREEPFGEAPNDQALNSICQTIETSLLEMPGQEPPAFPKGKRSYVAG